MATQTQMLAAQKAANANRQQSVAQAAAQKAAAQKTGMRGMGAAFEAQKAAAAKAAALKEAAPRAGVKPATGGTPQTVGGVRGVKTIPTAVPRGQAPRAGGAGFGNPQDKAKFAAVKSMLSGTQSKFAKGGATGRASARADGVASKGKTKGRMI